MNLDPEDVQKFVPRSSKVIMFELINAWARVDTTIAQLTAASFALDATAGAILMERVSVTDKIQKMRKLQLQLGRVDQAKSLRALKKQYEDHTKVRNLIAHAPCVGSLRSKPTMLVFTPFQVEGAYGSLAVEAVDIQVMKSAISWAAHVDRKAQQMLDAVHFYGVPDEDDEIPE